MKKKKHEEEKEKERRGEGERRKEREVSKRGWVIIGKKKKGKKREEFQPGREGGCQSGGRQ